jgi:prepilin-type N-terminal cleavage/methylation domain-containing protein
MTNKWKKAAFTLIEVLAAMSVLLLIMMGLMRIFPEASDAFEKGTETVNRNAAAQAALQIIKQDLEGLVADNRLGFFKIAGLDSVIATTNRTYENDRIYFVTTNGDQDDGRAYQYVYYRSSPTLITNIYGVFTNCRLMRARMDFDKANNDPMALGMNSGIMKVISPRSRWLIMWFGSISG